MHVRQREIKNCTRKERVCGQIGVNIPGKYNCMGKNNKTVCVVQDL